MTNRTSDAEVFGAINFLNNVMGRYPDAISFAPGAPLLDGISRESLIGAIDCHTGEDWSPLFQYGPSQGIINSELCRALSITSGLHLAPGDFTITVGAQEAFILLLRALDLHRCGTLGIVSPAYAGIRGASKFMGARTIDIIEGPKGVRVADVEASCIQASGDGRPIRAIYLAPDFSNPSGTVLPIAERSALLDLARRRNLLLIEDITYEFTGPTELESLKALDKHRSVVQVGTFSKVCLPGVRVGYVAADQPWSEGNLASWLATLKNMTTVNTSPINQAMIAGLVLTDPDKLRDRSANLARVYRDKRERLLIALSEEFPDALELGIEWNRPTGGLFVVMRTPWELDHAALVHSAVSHRVLWTPMRDFYAGHEGDHALRLACSHVSIDQISNGVRRLGNFLREKSKTMEDL